MATKKVNSNLFNLKYLDMAFNLASINLGSTGSNPSVGCVVEKNGAIISTGVTSINGRPHAEYNALNKKTNFKNSNLYVTLEPCSHKGLTLPCTNIIKKKRVKNVFFSIVDVDKRSGNKSKKILNKSDINIKYSLLKKKGLSFYKSYILSRGEKLPFVDAKLAVSKDYFTINKKSRWISNSKSLKVSHLIRSMYDCIISTSKSINIDNSLLNCRIDGLENKSPDLVIIDRNLTIKKKLSLFKISNKRKIIIFTSTNNKKKINDLKKIGVKVVLFKSMVTQQDYKEIFFKLKGMSYSRIFIESGLIFLNFLIKNKFISNLYMFKSNERLNSNGFNNTSAIIMKKLVLKKRVNVNLNDNDLYKVKLI